MNRTIELGLPVVENKARTDSYARRVLFVLGIALAFVGQVVLLTTEHNSPHEGWMQVLAGGMLLAGAILFGGAAREAGGALPRLEFARRGMRAFAFMWHKRWTVAWLAVAVVLAVLASAMLLKVGENQAVRWLWLASIAALLIAPLKDVRLELPEIHREERVYAAVLALLLVVALVTRLYKLTLLPYNMDGDFGEFGGIARGLVIGQTQNIFAYDNWGGMPMLGYLPSWFTMSLFGTGMYGLYMSGVIEGLLVIVGVYLLGRDLFQARVGLFAAALLTVSYTHLLASRQSNFIDPVPFLVFSIYFLLLGLRERSTWALVASGLLTALCVQMYFSGRIVVLIVGFIFVYLGLFHRQWLWRLRWALGLWALAMLITLGPMLLVFARENTTLMARSSGIFVLNPPIVTHLEGKYNVTSVPAILLEQARRTVFLFNYYNDTGPQFNFPRPFLDPISGLLFVLGMGYALRHWRRLGNALLCGWLVLGAMFGSWLVVDAPSWSRLMILLPPTALLASCALDVLYERLRGVFAAPAGYKRFIAPALVALCIAALGVMNWNTYVEVKGSYASVPVRMVRYLEELPPSTSGYLVSDMFPYDVREFRFLVPGRLVASLTTDEITRPVPRVGSPTLIFLTNEQTASLEKLKQFYPQGTFETHIGNAPDDVAFYTFQLP